MEYVDDCIRRRVEIDGIEYYIILSHSFVALKHPYEHRPENWDTTIRMNRVCEALSETMQMLNFLEHGEDEWEDE